MPVSVVGVAAAGACPGACNGRNMRSSVHFRAVRHRLGSPRLNTTDLEVECRVRPISAFSTPRGALPFLSGLAVRENDLEVSGAREAIAEAQTV